MLKIINDLKPFFENCYIRIGVREYSKIAGVSPPTSSKLLSYYMGEGLLKMREERRHMLFYADMENPLFVDLSRIYWRIMLKGLVEFLEKELVNPTVVLFGSLSKAETKEESDIDLAIFASKRDIDFSPFEKVLGRKIQVFWYERVENIKNSELAKNIINGYFLSGRM